MFCYFLLSLGSQIQYQRVITSGGGKNKAFIFLHSQCRLKCFSEQMVISFNMSWNPSTPSSGQDRISHYNINTISRRQVMRM